MQLVNDHDLLIRTMEDTEEDYLTLHNWLNSEDVLKHYQGRDQPSSWDEIIDKYRPRILGEVPVTSCIIEYKSAPLGYIQYYIAQQGEKKIFGYNASDRVYGYDLFIGERKNRNLGLGTRVINLLVDYIFNTYNPDCLVVDPRIVNKRAINCYKKCGFKIERVLKNYELHEGNYYDNHLMIYSENYK